MPKETQFEEPVLTAFGETNKKTRFRETEILQEEEKTSGGKKPTRKLMRGLKMIDLCRER